MRVIQSVSPSQSEWELHTYMLQATDPYILTLHSATALLCVQQSSAPRFHCLLLLVREDNNRISDYPWPTKRLSSWLRVQIRSKAPRTHTHKHSLLIQDSLLEANSLPFGGPLPPCVVTSNRLLEIPFMSAAAPSCCRQNQGEPLLRLVLSPFYFRERRSRAEAGSSQPPPPPPPPVPPSRQRGSCLRVSEEVAVERCGVGSGAACAVSGERRAPQHVSSQGYQNNNNNMDGSVKWLHFRLSLHHRVPERVSCCVHRNRKAKKKSPTGADTVNGRSTPFFNASSLISHVELSYGGWHERFPRSFLFTCGGERRGGAMWRHCCGKSTRGRFVLIVKSLRSPFLHSRIQQ